MPDPTLAQRIKAKYPGQYDDIPDAELESRITAKYPGVYDDIPKTTASPTPPASSSLTHTMADKLAAVLPVAADLAVGAAKGVGNTAYGLGKLVHDYTPIGRISDAIQPGAFEAASKPPELTPTNTAQKIGQGAEQVAEFLIPAGEAAKVGKLAEVAKSGVLSLAQTGNPAAAGLSAGLAAVLPGAKVAQTASTALQSSAEKEMAQALGATKEWAKSEAAKLAPQMLQRGIGGSREAMLATAKDAAQRVGANLNAAYDAAAKSGATVPSNIIAGNIQLARDAFQTTAPSGSRLTIPGAEPIVSKLNELADFAQTLGPDIPVDQAAHIKRTWDAIVSKAGLFGPKAAASATDNGSAWAIREASNSFRELLNADPTLADLNKEAAFWTGLKNVLKETQKRTQAQANTGLIQAGSSGVGAIAGALSGDSASDRAEKAVIGGIAARQLTKLLQSPAFRTQVSGPAKQALADALASGSAGQILGATQRAIAALPAQMRPVFSE